jgi:hypothetical protein
MYKMDDNAAKRLHKTEYMRQYRKRKNIKVLNNEPKVSKKNTKN